MRSRFPIFRSKTFFHADLQWTLAGTARRLGGLRRTRKQRSSTVTIITTRGENFPLFMRRRLKRGVHGYQGELIRAQMGAPRLTASNYFRSIPSRFPKVAMD